MFKDTSRSYPRQTVDSAMLRFHILRPRYLLDVCSARSSHCQILASPSEDC